MKKRGSLPTKGAILVRAAILSAAAAVRRPPHEVLEGLKDGARDLHAAFRASLAEHVANAVSPADLPPPALHLFGSSAAYECRPSSDVDILVQVDEGNEAVVQALRRINREALHEYRLLLGEHDRPETLLDIHVVTRDDVEERRGFAAVLTSLHVERLHLRPLARPPSRLDPESAVAQGAG